MKKTLILLLALLFIPVICHATRYESNTNQTESSVIYGKYNGTLVPIKVDENGVVDVSGSSGGSASVSDTVYGADWDGNTTTAPSKNAVYDEMETRLDLTGGTMTGDLTIGANTVNIESGTLEIPNSTTLPGGSCTAGTIYMDTNATSGQQIYGCEGGSWVLQGGAGTSFDNFSELQALIPDETIVTTAGDYTITGSYTYSTSVSVDRIYSSTDTVTIEDKLYVDSDTSTSSISFANSVSSDPCSTIGEGSMYYSTGNVICFCNGTNDVLIYDTTTNCTY
jgi:hypothetical protein